jgi:GNAT superfamily N-acetyltransferase
MSDPHPRVRNGTLADLDELVRLHGRAREHAAAERGGPVLLVRTVRPNPVEQSLRDDLTDEDTAVLIGLLGTAPVGFLIARRVGLHDGTGLAEVSELFVEPEARGVGVGAALMDSAIEWARRCGCSGIDAYALPGDRATKNFFESFGLVARAIAVHRDLGDS